MHGASYGSTSASFQTTLRVSRYHLLKTRKGGLQGWVTKVKGLKSTDWPLQNSQGDVRHGTRNTVNASVTTVWYQGGLEIPGGALGKVHRCLTTMPYS